MSEANRGDDAKGERDLLAEWLNLSREVLERYWPDTTHAVLVAEQRDERPAVQLVIPTCDPSASATRPE